MLVPEKEPEPLELMEEVSEARESQEIEALEEWSSHDAQAELQQLEMTMEEPSTQSTSARFLDRVPKPLLFGIPAGILVVGGLLLLFSSSGEKAPSATRGPSKEKPAAREVSRGAPPQTPSTPAESTKVEVTPAPPVPSILPAPEERTSTAAAPASPSVAEPPRAEEKPGLASSPAQKTPPPAPAKSAKEKVSPDKAKAAAAQKTAGPTADGYTVNVGSFRTKDMADAYAEVLKKRGLEPFVWSAELQKQGKWYRVSVGRYANQKQAEALARDLKEKQNLNTYVVKITKEQQ
jgi:cell division protein FtsN